MIDAHHIPTPAETAAALVPYVGSSSPPSFWRQFIGIEREPRYFDIAVRRISDALARPDLFIPAPKPVEKQEGLPL